MNLLLFSACIGESRSEKEGLDSSIKNELSSEPEYKELIQSFQLEVKNIRRATTEQREATEELKQDLKEHRVQSKKLLRHW